MTRSEDKRESLSDTIRDRAAILDWLPAVVALVVLGLIQEFELFGSNHTWKLFWSLINLAPALWIVRAVVKSLRAPTNTNVAASSRRRRSGSA